MAFRLRKFKEISRLLPSFGKGTCFGRRPVTDASSTTAGSSNGAALTHRAPFAMDIRNILSCCWLVLRNSGMMKLITLLSPLQKKESIKNVESSASDKELQEGGVCFDCAIAISPGTSELNITAPLYIRLKRNSSIKDQTEQASRIVDILDSLRKSTRDSVIQFLLSPRRDLEELIFVKCLHLRLKFDTSDHPKADNSKGVVLTDFCVEVNVSFCEHRIISVVLEIID